MDISAALKHRDRLQVRLADAYSSAQSFCSTSQGLNDLVAKAHDHLPKTIPNWVRAYGEGYRKAKTDELYRWHLVFGGMIDGVFYSTHRDRDDYYEKHGFGPAEYADDGRVKMRGHYWRKNTSKPFFVSHMSHGGILK